MDLQLAEKAGPYTRPSLDEMVLEKLKRRLGPVHARQRLGIEDDLEGRVFGRGLSFFHPENWSRSAPIIAAALKLSGLYWRARKNAERIRIQRNEVMLRGLPGAFDGF